MEANNTETLLGQVRACARLMLRLAHSEHRRCRIEDHRDGLSRGQAALLRVLSEEDGLSQMELAERLDIRPSSLGELAARLEAAELVERRPNENDKRVVNVFLTQKGRDAEQAFEAPRRQAAEAWCAGLSEEERAQLAALLGKLASSMQTALDAAGEEEFPGEGAPFGPGCGDSRCGGPGGAGWMHRGPHHGPHCHPHGPFGMDSRAPALGARDFFFF